MKKNLLITTGGSGGHVVPAIILFEHLSKEINLIITTDKRGLKYFDNSKYQFEIINTPKLNNIFLVKGTSNKKPTKSVKKPGTINKKAAKAIEAPDIIS